MIQEISKKWNSSANAVDLNPPWVSVLCGGDYRFDPVNFSADAECVSCASWG
jgi:hypothetical protein